MLAIAVVSCGTRATPRYHERNIPTFTEVLPSSSDARLSPKRLPTLIRELLLGARIPESGRAGGDVGGGGDAAMGSINYSEQLRGGCA